jgi:hypothetical protein
MLSILFLFFCFAAAAVIYCAQGRYSWRLQVISNSVQGISHLAKRTMQAARLVLPLLPVQLTVDVLRLQLRGYHPAAPV